MICFYTPEELRAYLRRRGDPKCFHSWKSDVAWTVYESPVHYKRCISCGRVE